LHCLVRRLIRIGLLHRLYSAEHVLDCAVMAIPLTGAKHPNSTLRSVNNVFKGKP
jgi:hypothetical protein